MTTVAILVGSSSYTTQTQLPCCRTDVEAIGALLESTERFEAIHRVLDEDAAGLKKHLRDLIHQSSEHGEIFFYFSGHGHIEDTEFFFCARDFDPRRPFETGLSNSELMNLFRERDPELVVKLIDACSSGALMIKSSSDFIPTEKGALRGVVQIASCLDSQSSLAGDPLSEFTDRFCQAVMKPADGPLYYMDIISRLRDDYLSNRDRQPHFVFQSTGRETLVDDASVLKEFRELYNSTWSKVVKTPPEPANGVLTDGGELQRPVPSLLELLDTADKRAARPEDVSKLVRTLFNGVIDRVKADVDPEVFEVTSAEHADFREEASYDFIAQVLSKERRVDQFVRASITRERKKKPRNRFDVSALSWGLTDEYEYEDVTDLHLNMEMASCQLRLSLTPQSINLKRLVLIVTCAPSIEECYVFEHAVLQSRTDFNTFADSGAVLIRRWGKQPWRTSVSSAADSIADNFNEEVKKYLNAVTERLVGAVAR